MTRFQRELRGDLGVFWQQHAQSELAKVKAGLDSGAITIDEAGVARNCIGRALMDDLLEMLVLVTGKADSVARNCIGRAWMDDLLEMLALVTDKADSAATQAAREAEMKADLESYRAVRRATSAAEMAEMRAAFGKGAAVVDVLTGEKIQL